MGMEIKQTGQAIVTFTPLQFIIWASIPCQPVSSANRNKKEWLMQVNDLCVLMLKRFVECLRARVAFMENPAQGEYGLEHSDEDNNPAREVS